MLKRFNLIQNHSFRRTCQILILSSQDESLSTYVIENIFEQGQFDSMEHIHIEKANDWDVLKKLSQNLTLIPEKKLFRIRIEKAALSTKHVPNIYPIDGDLFVYESTIFKHAFWDSLNQNKKSVDHLGIYKANTKELWQWLKLRLQEAQYQIAAESNAWFLEQVNIDFSQTQQLLAKLQLQHPKPGLLSLSDIQSQLGFLHGEDWSCILDAWMNQDLKLCFNQIAHMKQQQKDLSLFIWLLNRQLQVWYALLQNKHNKQTIYQQFKLWPKQIQLLEQSATKLNRKILEKMFCLLHEADLYFKTYQNHLAWLKLEALILLMPLP